MDEVVEQNQFAEPLVSTSIKVLAKKDDMTLPEALKVIHYYDSVLAGFDYKSEPPCLETYNFGLFFPQIAITTSVIFGLLFGMNFAGSGPMEDAEMIALGVFSSFLGITLGIAIWHSTRHPNNLNSRLMKIIRPKKFRKLRSQYENDMEFHALEIEEREKFEKKIAKRAKKALNIANSSLKTEEITLYDRRFIVIEKPLITLEALVLREASDFNG